MKIVFFFLIFACGIFAQPSWRVPAPSPASAPAPAPAPAVEPAPVVSVAKPRTVYRDRVVKDTLRIVDTLLVSKIDTVRIMDTVSIMPIQYRYMIRYALTSLNVEMANPEWLDYSSYNEIVSRDTATLKVGSEEIRTLGNTIDQFGNHIPQTDIITTGFTINVFGDRVAIEYRGKTSVAFFSGFFDNSGFLIANGEISETGFLASFFPFNLFFSAGKKRIIIQIHREAY
jgi:hypothetical protein